MDVEGVVAESCDFVAILYLSEAYGALCCVAVVGFRGHGLSYGVGYVE